MKFRMPTFGQKNTESSTKLSHAQKQREGYSSDVKDETRHALAELKKGNFTFPIRSEDKQLRVNGYDTPQDAWFITANSVASYFLLKDGTIISKSHMSSRAEVVRASDLLRITEELTGGLRLMYIKPKDKKKKHEPEEIVTEENEDEVDEDIEDKADTKTDEETEPPTRRLKTASTEQPGWHKKLPIEKQGRQTYLRS